MSHDTEEELLRSVAIRNAQSILLARQRAEQELIAAKEALEVRTAELERANALIRTIAENAASCLVMLDDRGVVTYMNPAAIAQTGFALEELATGPFHELAHAPPERGGHSIETCAIKNARIRLLPLKNHRDLFVRRDGTLFPVSCSLSPLQRDGRPVGAVLEFRDITDEQAAQKALEDANRRKDQFLATLSHELRTPMTAVLGWARMLKLGLPEAETREAIDAIEKSAEVQAQLIDDVLDVSRIVAGKMTFNPVPIDVGPVLRAAMTTVHPAASAKGIEILASVPPTLPRVLGDEGRMQQIIWNVLSNAVKFTPRGGSITIRLTVVGSVLRLVIQDSGKGIEAEYLAHVFEPFSQEDGSMTRSHEGIGLGLSIVRSLVELHGGRIRVGSEGAGRGATFTIDLPFIESPPSTAGRSQAVVTPTAPARASELPSLRGLRLLVIDDQEYTRDLVTAIFRRTQADVETASSVREGLQKFEATTPHVVVCDLAMPEEDGFAFVRAVRGMPAPLNARPIIALTAFGRPEDRQNALMAGFDDYLKKPVDPEDLASTVLRLSGV
ncbi:MAG: two-component sensor histidine kinase [Acidobacteria bacterium]|nr:two-component sensor histidine kinase [Acidobacteriota bacterium]